jgi:hypothetical protein
MGDLFEFDTEAHSLEQLLGHGYRVVERLSADHGTWWEVGDTQQQNTASLICDGNAVLEQLLIVELKFRFLEF